MRSSIVGFIPCRFLASARFQRLQSTVFLFTDSARVGSFQFSRTSILHRLSSVALGAKCIMHRHFLSLDTGSGQLESIRIRLLGVGLTQFTIDFLTRSSRSLSLLNVVFFDHHTRLVLRYTFNKTRLLAIILTTLRRRLLGPLDLDH